jgi:hypothetical protein
MFFVLKNIPYDMRDSYEIRMGLALSIGPNCVGFHQKTDTESSLRNVVLNKKMGQWDMHKNSIIVENSRFSTSQIEQ